MLGVYATKRMLCVKDLVDRLVADSFREGFESSSVNAGRGRPTEVMIFVPTRMSQMS